MSAPLSIQHKDDNCGCCDAWGDSNKQRKQEEHEYKGDDADIAKEMNELSFEQRERIFDDVHGVAAVQKETPEMVAKCIEQFDDAISKIPSKERKAYNKAVFLKPKIQFDTKQKLQFLRADEFDAEKAAQRMVKFYDQKCNLFGEEKLVKRLTLSDLSEDEIRMFRIGYMVELPFRDRSGRPIIFGDGTKLDFEWMTIDSILRAFWYLKVSCFDDEIAQKKGTCTIMRFSGARRSMAKSSELASRSAYSSNCFPGRNTSFHICYDDPRMDFVIRTLRLGFLKSTRVRTRPHFGSELENDYKLMTFGIPSQCLLQRAKAGDDTLPMQYLQVRGEEDLRADEEEKREEEKTGIILYPKSKDVLIGRGQPYRDLPSNLVWDMAIQRHFERYRDSTQFEKTCISMDVVKTVLESGGRFLERTSDGWKALDETTARKKTASAFRNRAREFSNTGNNCTKTPAPQVDSSMGHDAKRPRIGFYQ